MRLAPGDGLGIDIRTMNLHPGQVPQQVGGDPAAPASPIKQAPYRRQILMPPDGFHELDGGSIAGVLEVVAIRCTCHPLHEAGRRKVQPIDEDEAAERAVTLEAYDAEGAVLIRPNLTEVQ